MQLDINSNDPLSESRATIKKTAIAEADKIFERLESDVANYVREIEVLSGGSQLEGLTLIPDNPLTDSVKSIASGIGHAVMGFAADAFDSSLSDSTLQSRRKITRIEQLEHCTLDVQHKVIRLVELLNDAGYDLYLCQRFTNDTGEWMSSSYPVLIAAVR